MTAQSLSESTMILIEEAILYFNAHHNREQECVDVLKELGMEDAVLTIDVPTEPDSPDNDWYPSEWDKREQPYNKR